MVSLSAAANAQFARLLLLPSRADDIELADRGHAGQRPRLRVIIFEFELLDRVKHYSVCKLPCKRSSVIASHAVRFDEISMSGHYCTNLSM